MSDARRPAILMGASALAIVAGLPVLSVAIHETGHYLAALGVGMTPSQVAPAICGINPCVSYPDVEGWRGAVVSFSGGLTAALALAVIAQFALHRAHATGHAVSRIAGAFAFGLAAYSLGNGMVEGLYPARYGAGDFEVRLTLVLMGFAAVLGAGAILWASGAHQGWRVGGTASAAG